ncbi:Phosphotransferase enzyme family [Aspergillus sclerotialis]|uniref:Phosphotransferase enzyme family n=1 Tax=Aspergillus sclerotialis TaxID=2070753 RepID=A0A3A2ZQ29_9EURO|nr:Phosphotransferase enzyme family [Aspergillus sclerotialis]
MSSSLTHCDLTDVNIMVEDGHVTGIIDWQLSGYLPVWWEYVSASIADSEEDREWKTLLRKYMPDYNEAREFWLGYYHLSRRPESERPKAFIAEAEREGC